MVKKNTKRRTRVKSSHPNSQTSRSSGLSLEDVLIDSSPDPDFHQKNPQSKRLFYDLGPGGRSRMQEDCGTPVVFSELRVKTDSDPESRYLAYEQYINSRFQHLSSQGKPTKIVPRKNEGKSQTRFLSLYNVLQVAVSCSQEQVKAAYRRLALENHPDKGGNSDQFDRIKAAYDILSKPGLRETYNEEGFAGLSMVCPEVDVTKFQVK